MSESERCRFCGAPCAPDAWYCLECGEPVRPPAEPSSTPEGNRRATIGAVLALCLIGGGAGAYGLTQGQHKVNQPGTETAVPNDRPPKATGTSANTTTVPTTGSGETGTGTSTDAGTTPTVPELFPDDWKGSGYTVVVKSLSKAGHAQPEARTFAASLTCKAGVLDSSNYPALTPSYWVVYCGHYATQAAAVAAVGGLRSAGQADAYVRKVA